MFTAVFLVFWPLFRGIVATTDDLGLVLYQFDQPSFWAAMQAEWNRNLFRPLAVVGGFLTDPVSRNCWAVIPLHALALAIGALGLDRLAKQRFRGARTPRCAVLALWLLHPSTNVAVWQMDTLSQTACAGAGLWLTTLGFGAWRPRHRTLAWFFVTCLGLLTKETFVGWVLAMGVSGLVSGWRDRSMSDRRGELLGLAVALLFIALRLSKWNLASLMSGDGRYSLHLGFPLVRNIGLSLAGFLSYGPMHAFRLGKPTEFGWIVAAFGVAGHLFVLIAGLGPVRATIVRLWGLALLVLAPVLPMGQVSELYLCGPNALVALALVEAIATSWSTWSRRLPMVPIATVVLVVAACCGHVSRALHFDRTWSYARQLSEQVEQMSIATVLAKPQKPCSPPHIYHSVYVVSPTAALDIGKATPMLMERRGRPLPPDWQARLDCTGLADPL